MTKSTTATVLFCLGLTSAWLSTVQASGAHERYNPYGYISSASSSTATPTATSDILPTPEILSTSDILSSSSIPGDSLLRRAPASTSVLVSSGVLSSSTTTATTSAASTSTSGISIVSVGSPPPPQDTVYYIANGFFANWHALAPSDTSFASSTGSGVVGKTFGLDNVKWDLLDSLTYGYIPIPTSNFANISLGLQDAALIPKFVELAKTNNVTSILSLGGHISSPNTGGSASTGFAAAMATNETITEFVQGVSSLVKKLGVKGIEFDWEWTPCSPDTPYTSKELSTAFLSFLQQLRTELDDGIIITLAVGVVPFETPQIVLPDDQVKDTPLGSISLASTDPDLVDGATVATTLNGEYKNVTSFAEVVDYITVMNFDLYGAWSIANPIVLPNSPLNQTCPTTGPVYTSKFYSFAATNNLTTDTTNPISTPAPPLSRLPVSANTAVASWVLSGFRADQIILGVSASGRSYRVAEVDAVGLDDNGDQVLMMYPPFNTTGIDETLNATAAGQVRAELGDAWWWGDVASSVGKNASSSSSSSVSGSTLPPTGTFSSSAVAVTTTAAACVLPTDLSTISGVYTFQGLIEAGFLNDTGDVDGGCEDDTQPSDIIGGWDECSETPFLYDVTAGVMVSYDDAESMELKGQFILNSGIRGFSFYELGGDSNDATLLTAVRHGAGFPDPADGDDDTCTTEDDSSTGDDLTVTDWEGILQTAVDSWLAATSGNTTSTSTTDDTTVDTTVDQPTVTVTITASPTITDSAGLTRRRLRWERAGGKFWW